MQVSQTSMNNFSAQVSPAAFGIPTSEPDAVTFDDFLTVRAEEGRGGFFKKIKRITGFYHEKSVVGLEFIYELSKEVHNCRHGTDHRDSPQLQAR